MTNIFGICVLAKFYYVYIVIFNLIKVNKSYETREEGFEHDGGWKEEKLVVVVVVVVRSEMERFW